MSTDFGEVIMPIARKAHRCIWCGETIVDESSILKPLRVRHVKYAGVWNGDWQNWRMHTECYSDADESGELDEGFSPWEHDRPALDGAVRTL